MAVKIIDWQKLSARQQAEVLARPTGRADTVLTASVATILREVRQRGDAALRDYSRRFDKVETKQLRVEPTIIAAAAKSIDPELRAAMRQAQANITALHQAERPQPVKVVTMPGVTCELQWRPIETVGIYIPGGTAPLFSTLLMQAIPARIAGCRRVIVCTPPRRDGTIAPAILAAAKLCGLKEIYAVGGAQAIAAMAYGTATIPKVDKICGPGNAYVTLAKQLVAHDAAGAAIDMPAGPSEVMVIADRAANPDWVAADLLAQAEHDVNAQAMLVTTDRTLASRVSAAVTAQLGKLPRRATAAASLRNSKIIVAPGITAAITIANLYAPEHLIIHNKSAAQLLPKIRHAGSVFLGALTPESAGDYASGTNHVLPTYGYARSYSGLTVMSFMKSMSVQTMTRAGLQKLGPTIVTLAEAEGLTAHANAVRVRLGQL